MGLKNSQKEPESTGSFNRSHFKPTSAVRQLCCRLGWCPMVVKEAQETFWGGFS